MAERHQFVAHALSPELRNLWQLSVPISRQVGILSPSHAGDALVPLATNVALGINLVSQQIALDEHSASGHSRQFWKDGQK